MVEGYLRMSWTNYWQNAKRIVELKERVSRDKVKYNREGLLKDGGYVSIQVDEDRFLLPSYIKNGKEEKIITFLGGSTTECAWVKEELRFPYLTGKLLSEEWNTSIKILNTGVSAANLQDSLNLLLNKIIDYKPDIIVMMHAVNDAGILMELKDYKPISIHRPSLPNYLSQKSYLLGFLRHVRALYLVDKDRKDYIRNNIDIDYGKPTKETLDKFSLRLKIFIDICKDMESTPVLMTQPYVGTVGELTDEGKKTFLRGVNYIKYFNEAIKEVALSKNCLLIDLEKEIKDKDLFYDNIHYRDKGSVEISKIIFNHLKDIK